MKIGNKAYKITLLNVQPSYEGKVKAYLQENTLNTNDNYHKVLTSLGPFDVTVLSQVDSNIGRYPHVQLSSAGLPLSGFMSMLAYDFKEPSFFTLQDNFKYPVVLLAFLKISNLLVKTFGIEAEDAFVKLCKYKIEMANKHHKFTGVLLGSLGWYENILILNGLSIGSLVDFVLSLRRTNTREIDDILGLTAKKGLSQCGMVPILETSFTVPCIDEECLRQSSDDSLQDIVNGRITVTCKPGMSTLVADRVPDFFTTAVECRNPLGRGELIISIKMPFKSLIVKLLEFRNELSSFLIETETAIELDLNRTKTPPPSSHRKNQFRINIQSRDFSKIAAVDSYVHDRLQQVFTTLLGRVGDEIAIDCFRDLVPFVRDLARAVSSVSIDSDLLRAISQMCDSYFYGLEQRFQGSPVAMSIANSLPDVRHEAGIQRVILAANEVVRSVVKASNHSWNGFCVFGWLDAFSRLEHGVINIPWDKLTRPNDWWQLFHEAGHEFAENWNLECDREIKHLFQRNLGIKLTRLSGDVELKRSSAEILFFWELTSDLVDYYVGFTQNLKEYIKVTWGYLDSNWHSLERDTKEEQLLRTFFIFEAHRAKIKRKRIKFVSLASFKRYWRKLPNRISKYTNLKNLVPIQQLSNSCEEMAFYEIPRWIELHQYLVKIFESSASTIEQESSSIIGKILCGEPCKLVRSPTSLIRTLAVHNTIEEISFSTRIAVILSLYSTWIVESKR